MCLLILMLVYMSIYVGNMWFMCLLHVVNINMANLMLDLQLVNVQSQLGEECHHVSLSHHSHIYTKIIHNWAVNLFFHCQYSLYFLVKFWHTYYIILGERFGNLRLMDQKQEYNMNHRSTVYADQNRLNQKNSNLFQLRA